MSLKRGDFILKCDMAHCENVIELETDDFEEAKELAADEKLSNGWTTVQKGRSYADICPRH